MSQVPSGPQQTSPAPFNPAESKRTMSGILAILLGAYGVHKFVLGKTKPAVIMLVVSLTCVGLLPMAIIGIIEGIKYLQMTDEQFYQTYVVGNKEWM
jgi:TM2 domain-containing membrane protein YozV